MELVTAADEQMMLDLLNSTPIVDGEQRDDFDAPGGVRTWLSEHSQKGTAEEARTIAQLRPLLQDVVRGVRDPAALAPFVVDVAYRAGADDEGIAWELDLPAGRHAAARAVLAWDELRRTSPGRLRPCANPECQLFLIDRSKPNTARWCSMALCGNRMKARRHYQKARDTAQH